MAHGPLWEQPVRRSSLAPDTIARLKAARGPGESYSDVILRTARE
jgi:hypothetical protein